MPLKNLWSRHKLLVIIGAILLLALVWIAVTGRNQQVEQRDPATAKTPKVSWQPFDKQASEGLIAQPQKNLQVVFSYSESAKPQLSIASLSRYNGFVPTQLAEDHSSRLQLLDARGQVIAEQPFTIPAVERREYHNNDGSFTPEIRRNQQAQFVVSVPWSEGGTKLRVTTNNRTAAEFPVVNVVELQNTPQFESVQGDKLTNPTEEDKNKLNFLAPPKAHAQAVGDGKIDIVFVSERYTDMNLFKSDVERISKGFLLYEPMKTRASQFAFHKIENTENIGCKNIATPDQTTQGTSVDCDQALLDQRINKAGVPSDVKVVLVDVKGQEEIRSIGGAFVTLVNATRAPNSLAHEFGHVIGKLLDEYQTETANGPVDSKIHKLNTVADPHPVGDGNCYAGNPPSTEWNAHQPPVAQDGYTQPCTFPNWYAAAKESIMGVVPDQFTATKTYNVVSQCVINRRLDERVGAFAGMVGCAAEPSGTVPSIAAPSITAPSIAVPISGVVPTFVCAGSTDGICPKPSDGQGSGNGGIPFPVVSATDDPVIDDPVDAVPCTDESDQEGNTDENDGDDNNNKDTDDEEDEDQEQDDNDDDDKDNDKKDNKHKKKGKKKGLIRKGVSFIFNFFNFGSRGGQGDEDKDQSKDYGDEESQDKEQSNGYGSQQPKDDAKQPYDDEKPYGGDQQPYNNNQGYTNSTPNYDNGYTNNTPNYQQPGYTNSTTGYTNNTTGYTNDTTGYTNNTTNYKPTIAYTNNTTNYKPTAAYTNNTTGYTNNTNNQYPVNETNNEEEELPVYNETTNTTPDEEVVETYNDTTNATENETIQAELAGSEDREDKPRWKHDGGVSNLAEALLKLLIAFLNLIIQLLGGQGISQPNDGSQVPCTPSEN